MAWQALLHLVWVYCALHFSLGSVTCIQYNTAILSTTSATTKDVSPTSTNTSQVTLTPTAPTTLSPPTTFIPTIVITVTFTISWQTFCPLSKKFRRNFAAHLIEQNKDKVIHLISATRIHYVNVGVRCARPSSYGGKNAVVEFYVSERDGFGKVDEVMTIKAYRILDDYVTNKKMAKIDAVFTDKIKYVGISGTKAPKPRKRTVFTEFDRIAIGIGAILVIIFLAVLIYRRRKASILKSTSRQQVNGSSSHELEILRATEDT